MDILKVSQCERILFSSMEDLQDMLKEIKEFVIANPPRNSFAVRNDKIRARLFAYLCNGIHFEVAKDLLCTDFDLCRLTIDDITGTLYAAYLNNIKPHKVYAAHKLKAAGISNKDIARLLDVSLSTVSKYLSIKQKIKLR